MTLPRRGSTWAYPRPSTYRYDKRISPVWKNSDVPEPSFRLGSGRDDPRGMVYYVWHKPSDYVKIGTTVHLVQRYRQLDAEYNGLELVAAEPGSYTLETYRHCQFADARVVGEWFDRTGRLIELIIRLRGLYGVIDCAR